MMAGSSGRSSPRGIGALVLVVALVVVGCSSGGSESSDASTTTAAKATTTEGSSDMTTTAPTTTEADRGDGADPSDPCSLLTSEDLGTLIDAPEEGAASVATSLGPGGQKCDWDSGSSDAFVSLSVASPGATEAKALVTANISPNLYQSLSGVGEAAGAFESADGAAIIAAKGDVVIELAITNEAGATSADLQPLATQLLDQLAG